MRVLIEALGVTWLDLRLCEPAPPADVVDCAEPVGFTPGPPP